MNDVYTHWTSSNNAFTMAILKHITLIASIIVFSPSSLFSMMLMCLVMTKPSARDEIMGALNLTMPDDLNATVGSYLNESKIPSLLNSNLLWINQTGGIDSNAFSNLTTLYPDIMISNEIDTINEYVNKQSQGLIKNAIDKSVTNNVDVIMANAVTFKDKWAEPFLSSDTCKANFEMFDQTVVPVDMMFSSCTAAEFGFMKNCRLLKLKYKDPRMSMGIVLPDGKTPEAFLDAMNAITAEDFTHLNQTDVSVGFPKFTIESSLPAITDVLKTIGIKQIFESGSFISNDLLYMNSVVAKAAISVDEKETKAAGYSQMQWDIIGGVAAERVNVNRPFFFYLLNEAGDVPKIEFIGTYVNPK